MKKVNWIIVWLSLFLNLLIAPSWAIPPHGAAHWDYSTGPAGPHAWGELSPDNIACLQGQSQSPIDIREAVSASENPIDFQYQKAPLSIVNNGHTIQVNNSAQNSINIGDQAYQLRQFHFHNPSEHTILGQAYPLEMHLVHQNQAGQLAVIGALFEEGKYNPALDDVWKNMPTQVNVESATNNPIDVNALLPADRSYYHYQGSLTTPPCTEGVMWYVLSTPLTMSRAQIDTFRAVMSDNARPVQPLHQRSLIHVTQPRSNALAWGLAVLGGAVTIGAIVAGSSSETVTTPPIEAIEAVVDMVLPAFGGI
jgi:carbonic anhydrase